MSQSNPQPVARKSFQRLVDEKHRTNKARIRQQLVGRTEPFTGSRKSPDEEFWAELGKFGLMLIVLSIFIFIVLSLG